MRKGIILVLLFTLNLILGIPGLSYQMISANVDNYSSCSADLEAFEIDESTLVNDNQQVNVLLFAEIINESGYTTYYLYINDPSGFNTIEPQYYQSIQIGYISGLSEAVLNDSDAVARSLKYINLIHLSTNENGTVAKYLLNDYHPAIKPFRRYHLRQLMLQKNGERTFYTIGDEYFYKTEDDGSTEYKYKKMDYITLNNVILDSYVINDDEGFFDKLISIYGGEYNLKKYEFYGFSLPKKFDITDLIKVNFCYTKQDYLFYKPGVHFNNSDVFNNFDFVSKFNPVKSNPEYYSNVEITDKEVITNTNDWWFSSEKIKWNTISTKEDVNGITNEKFKNNLLKTFVNCDYIVNYAATGVNNEICDFAAIKSNGVVSPVEDYDIFLETLKDYDENVESIYTGLGYRYTKYSTSYFSDVEVVKLTINSNGEIYDLSVIVAPKDAPDNPNGVESNKKWWEYLIEYYNKLIKWIMNSFGVSKVVANLIAIVGLMAGISLLINLVFKNIGNIFRAIINLITWPFRLLFDKKEE